MSMKNILLSLLVVGTVTTAFGNEHSPKPLSIDAQISTIQSARPEERVTLMNQLKIQIANMNAKEKSAAIAQMQRKMQKHTTSHKSMNYQAKQMHEMGHKNKMQKHIGQMQSYNMQNINHIQNMHQKQAGNKYRQEHVDKIRSDRNKDMNKYVENNNKRENRGKKGAR